MPATEQPRLLSERVCSIVSGEQRGEQPTTMETVLVSRMFSCVEVCYSPHSQVLKWLAYTAVRQLEDPNKLLDTIVSDIQADLIKMRQASAEVCPASCNQC